MNRRNFAATFVLGLVIGCGSPVTDDIDSIDQAQVTPGSGTGSAPPESAGFPPGSCFRIVVSGDRYLDAYTSGGGDVVTRTHQDNSTQHWCFTRIPGTNLYTIQHRSFSGEFLDAYATAFDRKAVLRDFQVDGSQYWSLVDMGGTMVALEQQSTSKRLEARFVGAEDYRAVIRPAVAGSLWQSWVLAPL